MLRATIKTLLGMLIETLSPAMQRPCERLCLGVGACFSAVTVLFRKTYCAVVLEHATTPRRRHRLACPPEHGNLAMHRRANGLAVVLGHAPAIRRTWPGRQCGVDRAISAPQTRCLACPPKCTNQVCNACANTLAIVLGLPWPRATITLPER